MTDCSCFSDEISIGIPFIHGRFMAFRYLKVKLEVQLYVSACQNELKLTRCNVRIQKFSRGETPEPPLQRAA